MNCPRLHYQPDPSFIILKHLYSVPIEQRTPFKGRRRKKDFHARGSLAYLLKQILHFNVDFEEEINNMNNNGSDCEEIEDDGEDSFVYSKDTVIMEETEGENEGERGGGEGRVGLGIGGGKREDGGRGKKEERGEGGVGGGGARRESLSRVKDDVAIGAEAGLKRRTTKFKTGESISEIGEDRILVGRMRTPKLTQNFGESIYEEREDGGGGGGGARKRTQKFTQNNGDIDEEKPHLERKEKSKNTLNYSERFGSEIMVATSEGIERIESRVGKIFSKEDHGTIKLILNILFDNFNIFMIADLKS